MFACYCLDGQGKPSVPDVTSRAGITVRTIKNVLTVEDKQGYHKNEFIEMPFPNVLQLVTTGGHPIYYKDVEIVAEQLIDTTFFHVQCAGDDEDNIEDRSLLGLVAPSKFGEISPNDVTYLLGLAVKWGVEVPKPVTCVKCERYAMTFREVKNGDGIAYACISCCARFAKQLEFKSAPARPASCDTESSDSSAPE